MKNKSSITSESHHLANTMLGAGASSSDAVSTEQNLEMSAQAKCPPTSANDLLKLIQNAVPSSERMDFVVPFAKYQNVVNALEVCESYIKSLQQT